VVGVTPIQDLVILSKREAYLLAHVLAVFERLLRQGELSDEQLSHLANGAAVTRVDRADVEMAEIVAEAVAPLRRQL
jgi:hypothetical protein